MAVLIEGISVVIWADSLLAEFSGGWEAFKNIIPNKTLCADNKLVRVGFMTPDDVESFISKLQKAGLQFLEDEEAINIVVADQMRDLTSKCSWAEFGSIDLHGKQNQKISTCRLDGSCLNQILTPPEWRFDGSLSQTFGFVPTEHIQKCMKYLRHENGMDIYLNSITGEEMYVARTGE